MTDDASSQPPTSPSSTPASTSTGWGMATAGMSDTTPVPGADIEPRELPRDQYAGWFARLGASILDQVISLVVVAVLTGVAWLVVSVVHPATTHSLLRSLQNDEFVTPADDTLTEKTFIIWYVSMIVVQFAWETMWLRSKHRAKPGQLGVGFCVVRDATHERLTTGRSVGRAAARVVVYGIPQLGGLLAIVTAFTIALSRRRQSLHDMVAGTVCVRREAIDRLDERRAERVRAAGMAASVSAPSPIHPA